MRNLDHPNEGAEKINLDLFLETEKQKSKIEELERDNQSLKSELSKYEDTTKKIQTLQDDRNELISENTKLLVELDEIKNKLKNEISTDTSEKENMPNNENIEVSDKNLVEELDDARATIKEQEEIIDELEKELVELDKKYDTYIMDLKKKIKSLEADIERLEQENKKLSTSRFSHLRPQAAPHTETKESTDSALVKKMKEILQSWPGGIKVRNLAMSMGISVSATNEILKILEEENFVNIDWENAVNSNPVVHPV